MINALDFSDQELDCILHTCVFHGIDSMYTAQSFRHPEYHYLTVDDSGEKLSKCSLRKKDRKLSTRAVAITAMGLEERYSTFKKPEVVDPNIKTLDVYCSGYPNYFIYGVTENLETYSLISNQYWVRSSNDFESKHLEMMTLVSKNQKVRVN